MAIFDFLKPAPHVELIQDEGLVKKKYFHWRLRIFYSMYIGYAFFYVTRKSFTFAMPAMISSLGFTKTELGILSSILSLSYGLSKFVSGLLSDRSNPRYFMGLGLIMTGVFNICFGLSSSLLLFAIFWGLNGWFQGWGWPPCAKLLTHWYSQSERGRWWSVWNTSHNLGGALIPLAAGFIAEYYGWRNAMYVPGVVCIAVGLYLINRLRDSPQSLGLPSIEKYRDDYPTKKHSDKETERLPAREILFKYVLRNKYIWVLSAAYFFVYIVRTAVNDWTSLFLVETKGYSISGATAAVFWFEAGGFLGSLAAGWSSDKLFHGKRGPINAIFSFLVLIAVVVMWKVPETGIIFDSAVIFAIGFFIFGPQMLIGMACAELSDKNAAGTATGFAGWFAYIGAAVAGGPLGAIAKNWGWDGYFIALIISCAIAVLFLLPLWAVKVNKDLVES